MESVKPDDLTALQVKIFSQNCSNMCNYSTGFINGCNLFEAPGLPDDLRMLAKLGDLQAALNDSATAIETAYTSGVIDGFSKELEPKLLKNF